MRYRPLGKTGLSVSELGLGCEFLENKPYEQVKSTIDAAMHAGVNILDCFMSEPEVRSNIGKALAGRRERVLIQGHFRSIWKDNQYGRTMDIAEVRYFFQDLLQRLQTDYIDIGMLHLVDNETDLRAILNGEILQYALEQKEKGAVRFIGLSSHNAATALKAVKTGLFDVLLFSINPAYDLLGSEHMRPRTLSQNFFDDISVNGIDPERAELFRYCESNGIAITSMKTLAAGALLNKASSPFGKAMSVQQCMHYALTRPAVASALIGMQTPEEVADCLRYFEMTGKQLDYAEVLSAQPKFSLAGHCMYCNHCLPCSANLNIAQINKYLDLANMNEQPPATVRAHYSDLEHKASECIACGICEGNCPFGVPIIERMEQAARLFGE